MAKRIQTDLFGELGQAMGAVEEWAGAGGYHTVVGVDEAGRGPLAGPVVVAAVVLDLDRAAQNGWLTSIADSKQLKASEREELFEAIRREAVACTVAQAEAWQIDAENILRATLRTMGLAVNALCPVPVQPTLVAVDGNQSIPGLFNQRTVVKGDSRSYCIAAASIVAKVCRDRIMERYDRYWPHYGFARHKGYPTRQHREALTRHGPCAIHRQSFRLGDWDPLCASE